MIILNAQHPTACGTVLKLFHTRAAAEKEAIELLHIIGDDLVRWHERHEGEPHPKALVWHDMKARADIPFIALERFVVGLDSEDEDDQEWCVELIEKRPVDELGECAADPAAKRIAKLEAALASIRNYPACSNSDPDVMGDALDRITATASAALEGRHVPPSGHVATLCAAALAVVDAFGGDVPDWIADEIQELVDAMADVNHGPIAEG